MSKEQGKKELIKAVESGRNTFALIEYAIMSLSSNDDIDQSLVNAIKEKAREGKDNLASVALDLNF